MPTETKTPIDKLTYSDLKETVQASIKYEPSRDQLVQVLYYLQRSEFKNIEDVPAAELERIIKISC